MTTAAGWLLDVLKLWNYERNVSIALAAEAAARAAANTTDQSLDATVTAAQSARVTAQADRDAFVATLETVAIGDLLALGLQDAANLGSGAATVGQVLTADGSGGASWV